MDELDLMIKEACIAIADEQIREWEELEALEPVEFSESYYLKMEETFPFLKRNRKG